MPITVTNRTPTRSYNANSVSIDTLADVLGTLIEDIEANTYLGSAWSITNGTTDHEADAAATTINEVADLIATLVADNPLEALVFSFAISNFTPDNQLDCNSATITELVNLFATLVAERVLTHIHAEARLQPLVQAPTRVRPSMLGECHSQPLFQASVRFK